MNFVVGPMILPGKTIGILGGGQLGRMLAQAAAQMGYHVHIFEPVGPSPAGEVARKEVNAPYEDLAALRAFAAACDVVTYEFENVPAAPLRAIEGLTRLQPHRLVLQTCQNRSREKNWLREAGFPHAAFAEVPAAGDHAAGRASLIAGIHEVGLPCVVKTADFGYDGKGQLKVMGEEEIEAAAARFAGQAVVIERFVTFACEVSVVVARTAAGEVRAYPVTENIHTNHILDFSIVPARIAPAVATAAEKLACAIAEKISLVGVLGVEMFVTPAGEILVNELAPRTHNSGHWTLDACATSQFEQQVRAICGLPLGAVTLHSPVVMVNILGDAWGLQPGLDRAPTEPAWAALLARPNVRLHLYGKVSPRLGRKMGHFTVQSDEVETALTQAKALKSGLAKAT
ncbi:MAG TPA: 5-(carboxyamino)imidazole ribonucleotide synthase [Opitutaceae bacterium]|nr:5-(carboxyamino)imidazole ribonucleotide synthase [Opitutaceae bacterium]HRJ46695.1 5-(carboxyamino)imidazole ribonucleotide synthase [Opitutaceae bacterium]